jgi:hypothetical protein
MGGGLVQWWGRIDQRRKQWLRSGKPTVTSSWGNEYRTFTPVKTKARRDRAVDSVGVYLLLKTEAPNPFDKNL